MGEPEKRHIADAPQEPLANELEAFLDAVRTKNARHLVDPLDARHALQIALEALEPR